MTAKPTLVALLHGRLAREGLWVLAGQIGTALIGLGAIRVITEFVPAAVFGEINLALAALLITQSLFLAPILNAQLRFFPDAQRSGHLGTLNTTLLSALSKTSAVILGLSLLIGITWSVLDRSPKPAGLLAIGILWLAPAAAATYLKNVLNSERRQGALAVATSLEAAAKPALAIALVTVLGAATVPYLGGQALGTAAVSMMMLLWMWWTKRTPQQAQPLAAFDAVPHIKRGTLERQLWRYAKPLIPLAATTWLIHQGDRYILAYFRGTEELGLYTAAYLLASQPFLLLCGACILLFRPYMFEAAAMGDQSAVLRYSRFWIGATVTVGCAILISIIVLRAPIGNLLLADDYRAASSILPLIAAAYLLLAVGVVFENILLAAEQSRAVLASSSVGAAVSIGCAFLLIPDFSIVGASWATLLGIAAHTLVLAVLARHTRFNTAQVEG